MAQPFHVNQQEVFLSASIGIALCPRDAENVIDLIRNADAAMYYSKQNGGNTCAFYSPEMNAAAVERLMLKSKLKRALERDELVVRYMPKVDLADRPHHRRRGAAALAPAGPRRHPALAVHPAGRRKQPHPQHRRVGAEPRLHGLPRAGRTRSRNPGRISLNLSLKQLRQASFILDCKSVFARHGVSPQQLELEITETTLMADPKRTLGMLDELDAHGPAPGHRRLRHRLFLAVGAAAVSRSAR